MRHTKLPWKYDDGSIKGKNNEYICDLYMTDNIHCSGQDNARFIVQAVNSHEDLVEALKEAKNYIGLFTRAQGYDPKNEPTYQKIETALLKATEGEKE